MEQTRITAIVEAALMASDKPLSLDKLLRLFEAEQARPAKPDINEALNRISAACEADDRGIELKQVASGFRFQIKQDVAASISTLWEEKPQRYSRALLETLALIAYRQPITRGDIEQVRGVAVSSHITKTLLERDWVQVIGHREVPGRPALYATTRTFLDYFNLKSLDELPSLKELQDLDKIHPLLALEDANQLPPVEPGEEAAGKEAGVEEETPAEKQG
jgi:segregation and condensation protein B